MTREGFQIRMRTQPGGPVLEAVAVRKVYGDAVAVRDVSLAVAPGQCLALVGESGAGKSTLLRMFNRMVEPDSGAVRVRGVEVRRLDPVTLRRSLGYVQQNAGLLPHWTVGRNAALVPWMRGLEDAPKRAREALRRAGLEPRRVWDRYPAELSGGERQRAALARALAAEPDILLLDEPFGALDAITRSDVRRTFAALRARLGFTAVLVTHDLQEAFELADQVAVMRAGVMEAHAEPQVLRRDPPTPYVADLFRRAGVA